jgi:hypothetical protein
VNKDAMAGVDVRIIGHPPRVDGASGPAIFRMKMFRCPRFTTTATSRLPTDIPEVACSIRKARSLNAQRDQRKLWRRSEKRRYPEAGAIVNVPTSNVTRIP